MKNIDWRNHPNRKELEKACRTLSNACGIKKGDTVKVLRKAENYELGWPCYISDSNYEKKIVGHTFEVADLFVNDGIYILVQGKKRLVPFFVLEKIKDGTPEIKLTIDGKEVTISEETLENIRKEL